MNRHEHEKKRGKSSGTGAPKRSLQEGVVMEEDLHHHDIPINSQTLSPTITVESFIQEQKSSRQKGGDSVKLFCDPEFPPIPSSIDGIHKSKATAAEEHLAARRQPPKCRCPSAKQKKRTTIQLLYSQKKDSPNRPYYACPDCKFFQWAFCSQLMHWYRLGPHTGHVLVRSDFSAQDLLQGKVGDCWFLSALAVVAERPDLIARLFHFQEKNGPCLNEYGIVQVRLFVDGFWTTIVMDTFLPCFIDDYAEKQLQQAIQMSLGSVAYAGSSSWSQDDNPKEDPHALADETRKILQETHDFLEHDSRRKLGPLAFGETRFSPNISRRLRRIITSNDLAYSKAKNNQIWVPLLEKAYAKVHGCYKAISGGHIAEAFLDLTGAPTVVYELHKQDFDGRTFWYQLLSYRRRRLPMGCGTSASQAGIIGMHAYSILDVVEVRNVDFDFFRGELQAGTLGNVSGFTEFDGTVRLVRIRNPHGKGEWKGNFSDSSPIWERLVKSRRNQGEDLALSRTMVNDGTFWIDYDSFLMGFSNVDVVLAFEGNHAKSFAANFPPKQSNHRCARAFELCLLDEEPGVTAQDHVECFVMGIQKNKRGSYHGRSDRKKSYKVCDMGILVGETPYDQPINDENSDEGMNFTSVHGQMFGFKRNGHYRLDLDRKRNRRLVVMPISFGHPAATDKELSFVLRFVADAPVFIRELQNVPRLDRAMQKLFFATASCNVNSERLLHRSHSQERKRLLLDDSVGLRQFGEPRYRVYQIEYLREEGGTVFIYLCVNDGLLQRKGLAAFSVSFTVEANCRGMMCRTNEGLVQYETVAKGKMFEAAWRRYTCSFRQECKTRLLMTLVQSGQHTEMGVTKCNLAKDLLSRESGFEHVKKQKTLSRYAEKEQKSVSNVGYKTQGIFNGVRFCGSGCSFPSSTVDLIPNHGVIDLHEESNLDTDLDLQRALKLSRDAAPDASLEKALVASLTDTLAQPGNTPHQDSIIEIDESPSRFDADLERAIKMSLEEANSSQSPNEKKAGNRKRSSEVIEILDDDDGEL